MNYYEKYFKYKTIYFSLIQNVSYSNIKLQDGGSLTNQNKYICKPNKNKYKEICTENNNGKYKTKEDCDEDCDSKFISIQLKKANLHKESLQFYFFIQDLINKEQMSIYIKGGNVIGLAVLKLIYLNQN